MQPPAPRGGPQSRRASSSLPPDLGRPPARCETAPQTRSLQPRHFSAPPAASPPQHPPRGAQLTASHRSARSSSRRQPRNSGPPRRRQSAVLPGASQSGAAPSEQSEAQAAVAAALSAELRRLEALHCGALALVAGADEGDDAQAWHRRMQERRDLAFARDAAPRRPKSTPDAPAAPASWGAAGWYLVYPHCGDLCLGPPCGCRGSCGAAECRIAAARQAGAAAAASPAPHLAAPSGGRRAV
eukprot:TRINITY_DN23727_c0_g1_i1.p3 TRINITY_DN23727_c0_g1~~TRINITY_DN23727_c0_g1_i1.p3  ORF type:complete len:264 (+),score=73.11 TRINITY_DN23727_c0_g1_i1:68-793(+)